MLSLTEEHFETFNFRNESGGLRRPFMKRLELIEDIYGADAHEKAIELVEQELSPHGDPYGILWLMSPTECLELFVKVLEQVK